MIERCPHSIDIKSRKNLFVCWFFLDFLRTLIKLLLLRPVMHFLLLETDDLLCADSVFLRAAYSGYSPYIVKVSPVLLSLSLSTEILIGFLALFQKTFRNVQTLVPFGTGAFFFVRTACTLFTFINRYLWYPLLLFCFFTKTGFSFFPAWQVYVSVDSSYPMFSRLLISCLKLRFFHFS